MSAPVIICKYDAYLSGVLFARTARFLSTARPLLPGVMSSSSAAEEVLRLLREFWEGSGASGGSGGGASGSSGGGASSGSDYLSDRYKLDDRYSLARCPHLWLLGCKMQAINNYFGDTDDYLSKCNLKPIVKDAASFGVHFNHELFESFYSVVIGTDSRDKVPSHRWRAFMKSMLKTASDNSTDARYIDRTGLGRFLDARGNLCSREWMIANYDTAFTPRDVYPLFQASLHLLRV